LTSAELPFPLKQCTDGDASASDCEVQCNFWMNQWQWQWQGNTLSRKRGKGFAKADESMAVVV
jgi:hypothetical protein